MKTQIPFMKALDLWISLRTKSLSKSSSDEIVFR